MTNLFNKNPPGHNMHMMPGLIHERQRMLAERQAKRLPMSTDLDDVLRADDELFMPPEQPAQPEPDPAQPAPSKRPSRLAKVAEQAPPPPPPPPHNDDGVIDVDPHDGEPGGDSPI
jgi:hypothetical protein